MRTYNRLRKTDNRRFVMPDVIRHPENSWAPDYGLTPCRNDGTES
jgi:hypothetical protein